MRVSLHGDGAASGVIEFTFDQTPEQRIAGISVSLEEGPPPPPEVAPSDRLYTTTDAMVPSGDHLLSTRLYAPRGRTTFPIVVLMQGSGPESFIDISYTRILAQAFATQGIGVLAYDKAGTGHSTGTLSGSNFEALGADAASVAQYAQSLPQVERIGIWAHSQAGWSLPYALPRGGPVSFAIMVSPGGVNPFDQVAHFLHLQVLSWGLSPSQAEDADQMHRAVALYYAGRASYRSAQAEVDRHRGEPWFHRVVTNPYWDEMTPEGRVLTPGQLAAAIRERPNDFEIYRTASSFRSYRRDYERRLRLPTLTIYGADDPLVPVAASKQIFESVFSHDRGRIHDFRVFEGAGHEIRTSDGVVVPEYLSLMASWARALFDAAG